MLNVVDYLRSSASRCAKASRRCLSISATRWRRAVSSSSSARALFSNCTNKNMGHGRTYHDAVSFSLCFPNRLSDCLLPQPGLLTSEHVSSNNLLPAILLEFQLLNCDL